jgi:hypothetical protein
METSQLPQEVTQYLQHIKEWESLIRDEVATILDKIARGEQLTRSDLGLEITPSEVAAIWSVKNRTDISPRYVREVRRNGRIEPSQEWGKGSSYRCLYKVREIINIEVGHQRGRPSKKAKSVV